MRKYRSEVPRPLPEQELYLEAIYADDIDFISHQDSICNLITETTISATLPSTTCR